MTDANPLVAVAEDYLQKRLAGDVKGCVELMSDDVQLDSSHGCHAGAPAKGKKKVEERLQAHDPPRMPIEWKTPEVNEATRMVTMNGVVRQFSLTWYQRLDFTLTASNPPRISSVYWFGRIPVRDGEGCCV